jgi:AraC-like DNA-binding protein
MMPGIDGYQVCSRLKRDERTSHVPIVMLTAKATQEDRLKGLSQRADIYLTKPFFPKELLLHVANLIASRNALRERYSQEVILKPDQVLLKSIDEKFLRKVRRVVDDHLDNEDFNMEKLGAGIGMSRSQIHRKLHALTNQSATQFIRSYRLERAYQMLRQKAGNISEIAYAVGFSDPSYFSKCFSEQYKMSPSQVYKTV